MKLISARAIRERFISIGRKNGPAKPPSDMWLRRQIARGNLPPHDTLISGIRYWRESAVDAAIARLLANPETKNPPPTRSSAAPLDSEG